MVFDLLLREFPSKWIKYHQFWANSFQAFKWSLTCCSGNFRQSELSITSFEQICERLFFKVRFVANFLILGRQEIMYWQFKIFIYSSFLLICKSDIMKLSIELILFSQTNYKEKRKKGNKGKSNRNTWICENRFTWND